MNDALELLWACNLTRGFLQARAEQESNGHVKELLRRLSVTFNSFDGMLDVYLVCFCEEGDLLSQWRAYGANGGGYSLGFGSKWITMRTQVELQPEVFLRRVIYERSVQTRLLSSLVTDSVDSYKLLMTGHGEAAASQVMPDYCQYFRRAIAEYLVCFKHPTFHEEKEWRALCVWNGRFDPTLVEQVKFRPTPSGIIPYIELDLSPSVAPYGKKPPIETVYHGPTLNPELTKRAVELLLQQKNYPWTTVQGSTIPYRA